MSNFTHLHLHTKYSALDGAIKIDELANRLVELGMTACAITDHGCMYGIVDFYKTLISKGIKPILGSEFYISPTTRFEVNYKRGDTSNYHLVLLAENNVGLKNLYKLSSIGFIDGFYYKPRIDKEVLEQYHEGIIALSACLGGEIPRVFFKKGYAEAKKVALEYDRIMGRGNFFLEIQENGIDEQKILNKQLISISKETGIPLIGTADCHYLRKEDHDFHKILMRIQMPHKSAKTEVVTSINIESDNLNYENGIGSAEKDIAEYSSELYLKSYDEVVADFSYAPEAIKNSMDIADRCNTTLEFGNLHLPIFHTTDNLTPEDHLRKVAKEGLALRLKNVDQSIHQQYLDRLELELTVIIDKGFDSYFLIVQDFVNYAIQEGVSVGPGRGSGAGSLVSYSLKITDIDPMKYDLLFERFLNPERESMPDFDIDFCIKGRATVIDYVTKKYGEDKVSQIVTFSTLKPRNAIRDIGRALGLSVAEYDKLSKLIPFGTSSFADAFKADPSLESTFNKMDKTGQILKYGFKIEGLIRQIGLHAAGVIITDEKIDNYAPLARGPKKEIIIQFEKDTAEKIGLIKFDFLGLKNLTILSDAVRRIHAEVDKDFDLTLIPLDDKSVYEALSRGESIGVFQLESEGMRNLLKKLKPTVFDDIIAANALYRPGPINSGMLDDYVERKHGRQEIMYLFAEMEEVLKDTYGVIVYQEQVMQIARILGGYSLGAADILRRAMGKKMVDVMAEEKHKFLFGSEGENIIGAETLGFDTKKAEQVFDLIAQFAEYGFNKSHSAAYSLIAYQTAYLKVNYPHQYMPALLTGDIDSPNDLIRHLKEIERLGLPLLEPSINNSFGDFRYEQQNNGIRYALAAIKNIGAVVIEHYITERETNGKFKNIYDLCNRLDSRSLNKKVVETLILSGSLDCFGNYRSQHLSIYESCISDATTLAKRREKGIASIEDFLDTDSDNDTDDDNNDLYPDIPEMPQKELLIKEKDVLGFFLSDNPLTEIAPLINLINDDMASIYTYNNNVAVIVVGMISNFKFTITKKMTRMAFITLSGLDGDIELLLFPNLLPKYEHLLQEDQILTVKGKISTNMSDEDSTKRSIIIEEILDISDAIEQELGGISIIFDSETSKNNDITILQTALAQNSGKLPVKIFIEQRDNFSISLTLPPSLNIKPSLNFIASLKNLAGFKSIEPISKSDVLLINKKEILDDILEIESD